MKKETNQKIEVSPTMAARGIYKIAIVDARTKKEIWRQPEWGSNLILNKGLDEVAARVWADCMTYSSAGTGTTPTTEASGTTTAAQSSSTVTIGGGAFSFVAGDVGNVIKWNGTNQEARITAFTSSTQVTVNTSATIGAGLFTFYRTNQTGLTTEVKRTATYLSGAGNCETSVTGSVVKLRRTFDFTAEVGAASYTEVGIAWAASGINTHFARIVLAGAANLVAGQQLRVIYELQITMSPTTPSAKTAVVTGWPVAPSTLMSGYEQVLLPALGAIVSSGGTTSVPYNNGLGGTCNEPSVSAACSIFISPSSAALSSFNATTPARDTNWAQGGAVLSSYVALSFYRTKSYTFAVGAANRTDFRSIGMATTSWPQYGFIFLFDQPQTKTSTQTLTLTFSFTWGRTLPLVA